MDLNKAQTLLVQRRADMLKSRPRGAKLSLFDDIFLERVTYYEMGTGSPLDKWYLAVARGATFAAEQAAVLAPSGLSRQQAIDLSRLFAFHLISTWYRQVDSQSAPRPQEEMDEARRVTFGTMNFVFAFDYTGGMGERRYQEERAGVLAEAMALDKQMAFDLSLGDKEWLGVYYQLFEWQLRAIIENLPMPTFANVGLPVDGDWITFLYKHLYEGIPDLPVKPKGRIDDPIGAVYLAHVVGWRNMIAITRMANEGDH